ncbi:hypothetical protein [Comamonas testosteroni]|uniref:hypothetical protein n=1 Tax=Comamonas testosteroni TaxID=285 RepID=UPI0006B9601F|nr:hypothetical protein [Comamonas testosteroni]
MTPKLFQIFRAGLFTAMGGQTVSFSDADLHGMASAFNHRVRPAPLVLGHPENDKPEYGNVTGLLVQEGKLYAQANVNDELLHMVRAGSYRNVSASFLTPSAKGNPTYGAAYYLRHVGFLGSLAPAVKGLAPLNFGAHADSLCFGESGVLFADELNTENSLHQAHYDADRLALHQLALDYQHACPSLSYAEAVGYATTATFNSIH